MTGHLIRQNVRPVTITCEDLAASPQNTLATLLSALGLDPAMAKTAKPRTAKLANAHNLEWTQLFKSGQSDQQK